MFIVSTDKAKTTGKLVLQLDGVCCGRHIHSFDRGLCRLPDISGGKYGPKGVRRSIIDVHTLCELQFTQQLFVLLPDVF